jgi:hypothetical protein
MNVDGILHADPSLPKKHGVFLVDKPHDFQYLRIHFRQLIIVASLAYT